jgi:flagellar hook-length control protein FliK
MSGDDVSALAPGLMAAVVLATAPDPASAKLAAGPGEPADPETIAPATASGDGHDAIVSGARPLIVGGVAAQPVASASSDLPSALVSIRPDRSAITAATAKIEPPPATPDPASAPRPADGTAAGAPPDPGQAAAPPLPANETELDLIPASFSAMAPTAAVSVSSDTATAPRDRLRSTPAAALDLDRAVSVSAAAPPVDAPVAFPAAAGSLETGSLRPGEPGFAQAFSDHVLRLAANPGSEVTVRLHPPALGELTVRVAVSGHDVSAWFGSAQPLVQQAISEALGQLQTGLGNAGYTLAGAWVGADASGGRDQGYGGAPRRPAAALAGGMPPIGGASPANQTASRINVYV